METKYIVLIVIVVVLVLVAIGVGVYLHYKAGGGVSKFGREFQHNKHVQITDTTYTYVYKYKQELLRQLTKFLDNMNIEFVISHGNLIEYERQSPIYHDDDIDLRFNVKHLDRWIQWCKKQPSAEFEEYNLKFDHRFKDERAQRNGRLHVSLLHPPDVDCDVCSTMDIFADLVASNVKDKFWMDYDIDFSNRRQVTFLGIKTWAPSKQDTNRVLTYEYGRRYIIPFRKYKHNEYKLI